MNAKIKADMDAELHLQIAALEAEMVQGATREAKAELLALWGMVSELEASFTREDRLSLAAEHYSPFKKALLSGAGIH